MCCVLLIGEAWQVRVAFVSVIYDTNRGRASSVGRALDCRSGAGNRGFDSQDRTNTQGLKITKK